MRSEKYFDIVAKNGKDVEETVYFVQGRRKIVKSEKVRRSEARKAKARGPRQSEVLWDGGQLASCPATRKAGERCKLTQ